MWVSLANMHSTHKHQPLFDKSGRFTRQTNYNNNNNKEKNFYHFAQVLFITFIYVFEIPQSVEFPCTIQKI